MDTFDIFKKLTRRAKFKTKEPKSILQDTNTSKLFNDIVKTEKVESEQHLNNETTNNNEIALLKSMVVSDTPKKGKKRKAVKNEVELEEELENEKINNYRNVNNIHVVGRHVPEPAKTFEDFSVTPDLIENLKKCGYSEPTAVQKQAVPIMLQRRQLLACAPTGSGKTAAFLIPLIHFLKSPQKLGFRGLILCPTRELAKQTQRECVRLSEGRNFSIHVISKIKKALTQYGPKSSKKFDILITTPNRLCYLLNQEPPALTLENVEWIVVDEADKLFESGQRSFRDQLEQILNACTKEDRKIAMFSATYTPVVAKWCVHNMKGLIRITIGQRNSATDLVDQELLFVGNEQGKLIAFRDLVRKGLTPPVLVFVQSKERAQQLFNELIYDGINVDAIHSDRTQLQRDNTVRSFREGHIWILICTELMARGIDFKGINLVINYDFPQSAISYIHRVGRAGRAGRKGKAITFFTTDDTVNLRSIAHVVKQSGCEIPEYMLKMKKRSKKEKKKLMISAPSRDDITTAPIYDLHKKNKRRKMNINDKQANVNEKKIKKKTIIKKINAKQNKNNPKNKRKTTQKTKEKIK